MGADACCEAAASGRVSPVRAFKVKIEGAGLAAARSALEAAGIQPHGAGWDQQEGEYGEVVAPQIRVQVDAADASDAEDRVRKVLAGTDFAIVAEPL